MEDKESFVCYDVEFESSLCLRLSKQMEAQSHALLLTDLLSNAAFAWQGPIKASTSKILCQVCENTYINSPLKVIF